MTQATVAGRRWSPPNLIKNPWLRWGLLIGAIVYIVLAVQSVEVNPARIARGMERGVQILAGFIQPNFVSRRTNIINGLIESLVMTVVATAIGVVISVPIGIGGARNLVPLSVYLVCRLVIALSRTFQEVIIAILFVVMLGFGPLAGVMTLVFGSIGFVSKLLAEDIEEIDADQVEAMRATGASWIQMLTYGVLPQVLPRLVGLSLYRFDINLRESAVIGIVGAGGIGATLNTAIQRYEYNTASAILLLIIALVMATELVSSAVRERLQ
ncbi:phosphonate ABC transporter, permease protein PhnE [Leptolyngbya sp. KIOST-1]|uniref:phosphonate ABC transporter, permease protein PhnE n=1 Tax=Leptolyngbya sp. KIOST-1 TaxID=1229172 RepID=UPI00056A0BFC|nr:phosphonate ABC transporter, permease protein PhnE [Leptolyngbya sp. KIOST-1]